MVLRQKDHFLAFFGAQKVLLHGHQLVIPKAFVCANTNRFASCNFTFQIARVVALKKPPFLSTGAFLRQNDRFFAFFRH